MAPAIPARRQDIDLACFSAMHGDAVQSAHIREVIPCAATKLKVDLIFHRIGR